MGLSFWNEFVRQADGLGHGMPARHHRIEGAQDAGVFLIELEERVVAVLLRIALPGPGRGELAEAVVLHLEDEEAVERVEDEEVALAPHAVVVRVVEAPADRPALAELGEEAGDLDLVLVAVFGGAVVEPAGHGDTKTEGYGFLLLHSSMIDLMSRPSNLQFSTYSAIFRASSFPGDGVLGSE